MTGLSEARDLMTSGGLEERVLNGFGGVVME